MAVRLLNAQVSELCLGKPHLRWVSTETAVSDAVAALKRSGETHISVWSCGDSTNNKSCVCVGKISVADVILFLCRKENLADPFKAFEAPVSDILPKESHVVKHLEPDSSLIEAIDYILEGAQNLVIPIQNPRSFNSRNKLLSEPRSLTCARHNGHEYCWLTLEDVLRFLLNSISAFSPIPTFTIESLGIINNDIMTVLYDEPASSMLEYLNVALAKQTSVAVVDESRRLISEISPAVLSYCDETAAAAILALSAGELMAYIDCGGPPEDLVQLVKTRLDESSLGGMLDLIEEFSHTSSSSSSCCSSSDDESWSSRTGGSGRCYPARSEVIVCNPSTSLVAMMIQALAHRVNCVWVVEENHTLVGNVTFAAILKVFRGFAGGRQK